MLKLDQDSAAEWRSFWPLVFVCFLGFALVTLPYYTVGLFMKPMENAFGWSRADFTSGHAVGALVGAFLVPVSGRLIDRFGPRRVALPGVVLYCAGFMFVGLANNGNIWLWRLTWVVFSFASVLIANHTWSAAIASRFKASRGLAFAVALSGSGLGAALVPALTDRFIDYFGWRLAYTALGGAFGLILIPAVFFLFYGARDRDRRSGGGEAPAVEQKSVSGLALREGYRSGAFLRLALASFLLITPLFALLIHFVPLTSEGGLARTTAADIAGLTGITSIIGRLVVGALVDRYHGPYVGIGVFAIPVIVCLVLLGFNGAGWQAAIVALLLGAALGGELNLLGYLAARYFGLRNYATLFGTILGVVGFSGAFGPWLAAIVHDRTHSYQQFLWIALPMFLLTVPLIGTLGPYPVFAAPDEAPPKT